MMKIRFRFGLHVLLLGAFFATTTLFAVDVNWISVVRQRLDLEQKSPNVLIKQKASISKSKKDVLDEAVEGYNEAFQQIYDTMMPAFDSCKRKSQEWCDLKDYLEESKKALDNEYKEIQGYQPRSSLRLDAEEADDLNRYQLKIEHYYNNVIKALQKVSKEGQAKEVKLFKEAVNEKRQEKLREKRSDETAILQEET